MAQTTIEAQRYLATGDEAGTAPGDRKFRPDVEGLRAVAVVLVVLYHAGVPHLTGGFVGVDVFFVISGFVITGLLLRERSGTGRTSILDFYARRCRRILPAATLVILVTVVATYVVLGVVSGGNTADDGRWAAIFLANFHFEALGTNYLSAFRPPSPLQNYWTLSVEEQFYIVYPTLFLVVARIRGRLSLQARMAVVLSVVIGASYWLSITQTDLHPASAYFSPFTRAWELALGALVAIGTIWLKRIPAQVAAVTSWAGVAAILVAGFAFNAHTVYPGSLVAVPVVGAALVIVGGAAAPRGGAEFLLGLRPFGWLGRLSYSLYLWHWPILIIAAEQVGKPKLPLGVDLLLVVVAVLLSMATYRLVENPIRHWGRPSRQSIGLGVALIASALVALSLIIVIGNGTTTKIHVIPAVNEGVVAAQVAAAPAITTVSPSIRADRFGATYTEGGFYESLACQANFAQTSHRICPLGDTTSQHLMVLYGDSHALMWIPAFKAIATAKHWKLVVLGKYGCPAVLLTTGGAPAFGGPAGKNTPCDQWHTWATKWIDEQHPDLLVISQADGYGPPVPAGSPSVPFTAGQWHQGLAKLFTSFTVPGMQTALLGTTPVLAQAGPVCLAAHPDDVHKCSSPAATAVPPLNAVDRSTALEHHVDFIDTIPWFCSATCTPIIGKYEVYDTSGAHVSGIWATYLLKVIAQRLGLPITNSSSS